MLVPTTQSTPTPRHCVPRGEREGSVLPSRPLSATAPEARASRATGSLHQCFWSDDDVLATADCGVVAGAPQERGGLVDRAEGVDDSRSTDTASVAGELARWTMRNGCWPSRAAFGGVARICGRRRDLGGASREPGQTVAIRRREVRAITRFDAPFQARPGASQRWPSSPAPSTRPEYCADGRDDVGVESAGPRSAHWGVADVD